jgi:thiol-disulfide isomerase/thioredoxin
VSGLPSSQPRKARPAIAGQAGVARRYRAALRRRGSAALAGLALAAGALALAGCDGGAIAQSTPVSNGSSFVSGSYSTTYFQPGSRQQAPDVTGTLLDGRKFRLSSYRGDVVVLNFWGSWCAPCREEAPVLAALARHFASTGVRFLGVDMNDNVASARAYMQDFRISYPSFNDPGGEIALAFHGTVPPSAIPTTLVLDRAGRIAARVVGGVSYSGLRALIVQVRAERT